MKIRTALVIAAGAVAAAGLVTACSNGTAPHPTDTVAGATAAAAMPATATFIADIPVSHDEPMTMPMTMAITVDGDDVVAYATNGSTDEAYFVGQQRDGRMDLMSVYGDELEAAFDGTTINGELTMNEADTTVMTFAASRVAEPAGLYTAKHGDARATYVVRPDRSITGVMNNSAPGDHKVTDAIKAKDKAFMDQVRQMRLNQQLSQAPAMRYGTWSMDMHGTEVTATRVSGAMSF